MTKILDGRSHHPLWDRYNAMKQRCSSPSDPSWPNYGGRGITVCSRWRNDFWAYVADLGSMPAPGLTVDRIDNDGNYEPGNVRWATIAEQSRNRRPKFTPATVCQRGHGLTPDNTYTAPNGARRCRICSQAKEARRNEQRKAARRARRLVSAT